MKELGHDVIVANARKLRMIFQNDSNNDRLDAEQLARVARLDPKLPVAPVDSADPAGELSVPRDVPLVFLLRCKTQTRRATFARATDGLVVRFDERDSQAIAGNHQEVAGQDIVERIESGGAQIVVQRSAPYRSVRISQQEGPDLYELSGAAGSCFLLEYRRKGHASLLRHGCLGQDNCALAIELPRWASLQVDCAQAFDFEGLSQEELQELHPGPLQVVLRLADGRRLGVSLELGDGEQRMLRVE